MSEPVITVLIADDTAIAREGLKHILETVHGVTIVDEASTVVEAVSKTVSKSPDILLVDLHWKGDDRAGASAIRQIKGKNLATKIVAITAYQPLIDEAIRAGANIAITKDFTRDELVSIIKELARQHGGAPASAANTLDPIESLTVREREVLRQIADGRSDRDTAVVLAISENTVKNHVQNILSKLGAKNRTHAVRVARDNQIL